MLIALDFVSLCLFFGGSHQNATDGLTSTLLLGCIVLSLVIFFGVWFISCLQIVFMNIPTAGVLKNSLLLLFGRLPRMVPATLIHIVFLLACFFMDAPCPDYSSHWRTGADYAVDRHAGMPPMDEVFKLEEQLKELREKELSGEKSSISD